MRMTAALRDYFPGMPYVTPIVQEPRLHNKHIRLYRQRDRLRRLALLNGQNVERRQLIPVVDQVTTT